MKDLMQIAVCFVLGGVAIGMALSAAIAFFILGAAA